METLGVVGGMGPMATVRFYERVTELTRADTDQQHLDMIIYSIPSVPDRTAFLRGLSGASPLPPVSQACVKLEADGAGIISIPCVTMSSFIDSLRKSVHIPIIDMVEETVSVLTSLGVTSAGIMATDGTLCAGRFRSALESAGIKTILPDETAQSKIMRIIYDNVKKNLPVGSEQFRSAADGLFSQGAQCVILGCTELSVVKRECDIGKGFIDALDVLALTSVIKCGAVPVCRYADLIS